MTEGLVESNLPCWCGKSSDGCAAYQNEKLHLHCFVCDSQMYNPQTVEKIMTRGTVGIGDKDTEPNTPRMLRTRKEVLPESVGEFLPLDDRGIKKDVAEFYNVKTVSKDGKKVARIFPFEDSEGNLLSQKIKSVGGVKQMSIRGGKITEASLFGKSKHPAGGKFVTITEGEEDSLAAFSMLKDRLHKSGIKPAVVSVKNGAAGAVRDVEKDYEYLDSFEKIIISFDGDEPGREAARRVAEKFPSKAHVMYLEEGMDANEYLKQNRDNEYVSAWWAAEKYAPHGVITHTELWNEMTREDNFISVPYPWEGLNGKLYGLRTGDLVILKAFPKIGKTAILAELAFHVHESSPCHCGIIFLEDTVKSMGLRMPSLVANTPFHRPNAQYSLDTLKEAHEYLQKEGRIHYFDPRADRSLENIFNKMKYFVLALGVKYIFLDHISMFSYDGAEGDERRFLDRANKELKDFAVMYDICIITAMHVNDDGKTRGTRAAGQLCDVMLHLERDKLNSNTVVANTIKIIVEENRISGDSGDASFLSYNKDTGRLVEVSPDSLEADPFAQGYEENVDFSNMLKEVTDEYRNTKG